MTGERDFERVLNDWFGEGPTRMPDGFFDRIVGRIEAVPQSRLARVRARALSTKSNVRLAARPNVRLGAAVAMVVVLLVGVAGVTVLTRAPAIGALPSPSPSASPSPSGAPFTAGPTALLGSWIPVGAPSPSARFSAGRIEFLATSVMMHVGSIPFYSSLSSIGPDRFELWLLPKPVDPSYLGCNFGDHGTYAFGLASNGLLKLSLLTDACAARAEILTTTWTRYDPPTPPETFPPP